MWDWGKLQQALVNLLLNAAQALKGKGQIRISCEAAAKMEDALQWSVDFSHTQKGDRFKVPEKRSVQRYLAEHCKLNAKTKPSVGFVRKLTDPED